MKRQMFPLIVALILISPLSHAADTQASPDEKAFQDYMSKVQTHMKTMQEQMQKLQQTTDPKERQHLMQEHWTAMQDGMKMMHGSGNMPGCMTMGGGPMMEHMVSGDCCGGANGDGHHMMGSWWDNQNLSKEDMNQRMQMMGACMGMQQMMMDQMMMHQNPSSASDTKKP